MKFNYKSINRNALLLLTGSSLVLAAGCVPTTTKDLYNPEATDKELQLLGDSYIDYENPAFTDEHAYDAYVPALLNDRVEEHFGLTEDIIFQDRSVSGSVFSQVVDQYKSAREDDLNDDGYAIQTIIMNGGGNDLRSPCAGNITTDQNGDYLRNDDCDIAIQNLKSDVAGFFAEVNNPDNLYGAPPAIVWLGRYYFPNSTIHSDVVDDVYNYIQSVCNDNSGYCYYVDARDAWPKEDSAQFLQGVDEDEHASTGPTHLNEAGGIAVVDVLWDVLTDQNNDIYFGDPAE